jgi:cytochrome P450 family 628
MCRNANSIFIDPRYFTEPDAFLPERWSSQPSLMPRKDAFSPFLTGKYSCVGKNLAMMEMRMFLSLFIRSFTFSFPGNDRDGLDTTGAELTMNDYFTAKVRPFKIVLRNRDDL